jgi:hypothetical protein
MMSKPNNNDEGNPLREELEELESLLDADKSENKTTRIQIPVLDEVVSEADFIEHEHEDENDIEQIEAQISELAEKLEHKFSGELDQLVSLLKNNLRSSIIEELRNQANLDQDESAEEERPTDGLSGELESDIQKNS